MCLEKMGLLEIAGIGGRRWECHYEKLNSSGGSNNRVVVIIMRRRRWIKKMLKRGMKGFRLYRFTRLRSSFGLKVSFLMSLSRRIREIVNRMKFVEDVCPNIIFSTQWGLPVLSYI